ncbi:hypothetical protein X777_02557 [Ooceraea biroi]|uniref:Uncharacterized protein n=1 Tax=Ooceraea biroi TaxID=2015173 RepID=A0A026WNQ0_OOCBI|nr:hypothetical protein X777_02557 [Ooceraea biroi]
MEARHALISCEDFCEAHYGKITLRRHTFLSRNRSWTNFCESKRSQIEYNTTNFMLLRLITDIGDKEH